MIRIQPLTFGYIHRFLEVLSELTYVGIPERDVDFAYQYVDGNLNGIIYIAIDDYKVVGTASIHILPKFVHNISHVGLVEDVVTKFDYRGQGIGKQLMEHIIMYAKGRNCYKVILNCSEDNQKFYEKCGFRREEMQMRLDLF